MTKEDKELLFIDLCSRLPYGVKVKNTLNDTVYDLKEYMYCLPMALATNFKPYLRPMSSMTDEEIDKMWEIYDSGPAAESSVAVAGYLYERGLDCHHLIEKGLALEAPEDMYKTE